MSITNPSFEDVGSYPGSAYYWSKVADSQFADVAEFDEGYGWEGLERNWRLPLGRRLAEELAATETVWASLVSSASPAVTIPSASSVSSVPVGPGLEISVTINEYVAISDNTSMAKGFFSAPTEGVVGPVAIIASGAIPPGGPVTVTMFYSRPGTPVPLSGRVATVEIPAGSELGKEYVFKLQGSDVAFNSIEGLAISENVDAVIHVLGSWLRSPYNQAGIFAFTLDSEIDLFSIDEEDFESEWGCLWEPPPSLTGIGPGFLFNFDAVNKEAARFLRAYQTSRYTISTVADLIELVLNETIIIGDKVSVEGAADISTSETIVRYESFESNWLLSTLTQRDLLYSLASFVLNDSAIESFAITQNINDRLAMRWSYAGTVHTLNIVLSNGVYTRTSIVNELNNKIKAALDTDPGHANGNHFLASITPGGRIRLETFYEGIFAGAQPKMELIDPPSDSAWATLGFTPVEQSNRYVESQITDSASFDTGTPESIEDFEEEWRSNENSKLTLSPSDLDDATFASSPPKAEEFNGGDWTLVLS